MMKKIITFTILYITSLQVYASEIILGSITLEDPGGCGYFIKSNDKYILEWLYEKQGALLNIYGKDINAGYMGRDKEADKKMDVLLFENEKYRIKLALTLDKKPSTSEGGMDRHHEGEITIMSKGKTLILKVSGVSRC